MAGNIGNNEPGGMTGRPDEPGREERLSGAPEEARELGTTREGIGQGPSRHARPSGPHRREGSPLGTDPQDGDPLPGDPREAQEVQEPRSSHVTPGRHGDQSVREASGGHEDDSSDGVVEQLREAWDRLRGKK